jgi:hypothetical protein
MSKMTSTPNVVDGDKEHYAAPLQATDDPPPGVLMNPVSYKERAIAEAVVRPLGVQPSVDNCCRLFLQTGQLLGCCSYKATPSSWLGLFWS